MNTSAHDAYLEAQVLTATPQRLRLMLIEAALRTARQAQACWRASSNEEGDQAIGRCREILCELIGGIRAGETATADRVLSVYLFLFNSLTTAQSARDSQRLGRIIQVLEEEQETWREVCLTLPDRPATPQAIATREEFAPQRVNSDFAPHAFGATSNAAARFSIDA
jgi:flagellar secretion chaperone FliS